MGRPSPYGINYEGVCRTAPATLGLSISVYESVGSSAQLLSAAVYGSGKNTSHGWIPSLISSRYSCGGGSSSVPGI